MGEIYSNHLEYELSQDEEDKSDLITFQKYLANMTAKTEKYTRDQLFHAISCDNNPTTVHFMYFRNHKVEAIKVLKIRPCILFEELLIKPRNFITISGIERSTMGIYDKEKRIFTDPNELDNEEPTECVFEDTGLAALNLDQEPQAALKKKR